MELKLHPTPTGPAAEVISDSIVIKNEQDALICMEELFPAHARKIILQRAQLAPEFFELQTGLAGAVLQKFVNYAIQVAIVGDFSAISSRALRAFISESNRGSAVFFVETTAAAVKKMSG